jgi:hypothetical protein
MTIWKHKRVWEDNMKRDVKQMTGLIWLSTGNSVIHHVPRRTLIQEVSYPVVNQSVSYFVSPSLCQSVGLLVS